MVAKQSTPIEVADYTVLSLRLPQDLTSSESATHCLYLRAHAPKIPCPDSPRSAFLVNVPVDTTEAHLRALFATYLGGVRIERVEFDGVQPATNVKGSVAVQRKSKKRKRGDVDSAQGKHELPLTWDRQLHKSGSAAVVVLVDQPSLKLALSSAKKAAKKKIDIVWGQGVNETLPALGIQRRRPCFDAIRLVNIADGCNIGYVAHQSLRYPDPTTVQSTVDAYMAAFSAAQAASQRALSQQRSIPDADGFVTVSRGGRVGPARVAEAQAALERKTAQEEKEREGRQDFYRWQHRERNKARAGELIKAFEEDRKRVGAMREGRVERFKPM